MVVQILLTADETRRLQNLLFLLLIAPQVCERVDDDAKDQVEDDDDDDEVEQQVVHNAGWKQRFLHTHTQIQRLKIRILKMLKLDSGGSRNIKYLLSKVLTANNFEYKNTFYVIICIFHY